MPLFSTITDLVAGAEVLRQRRYGRIEVEAGRLCRIVVRPIPKRASLWESRLWGPWRHHYSSGDRCWLYYNQPAGFPQFLALQYVQSTRGTTFATFRLALGVLDEVARIKGVDALLCDASNRRISPRLLARWGWEPHAPMRWRRNYIKRLAWQTTGAATGVEQNSASR